MQFSCTAKCHACGAVVTAESRKAILAAGWTDWNGREFCPACRTPGNQYGGKRGRRQTRKMCAVCGETVDARLADLPALGWTAQYGPRDDNGRREAIFRCEAHRHERIFLAPEKTYYGPRETTDALIDLVRSGLTPAEAARRVGCSRQNAQALVAYHAPELLEENRRRRIERTQEASIARNNGRIPGFRLAMLRALFSCGYMYCTGGCGLVRPLGDFAPSLRVPYGEMRKHKGYAQVRICRACGNQRTKEAYRRAMAAGKSWPKGTPESLARAQKKYWEKKKRERIYGRLYALIIRAGLKNTPSGSGSGPA